MVKFRIKFYWPSVSCGSSVAAGHGRLLSREVLDRDTCGMGGEKVVDDLDAVVGVDVAQSCEASEHYRSEELNEGEGGVDLAEHSAGVRGASGSDPGTCGIAL